MSEPPLGDREVAGGEPGTGTPPNGDPDASRYGGHDVGAHTPGEYTRSDYGSAGQDPSTQADPQAPLDGGPDLAPPAAASPEVPAPLRRAELLSADEASQILARSRGRVVVWMGEDGCGKTTLTVRLYERQRLVGESARFAGSATLLAFEALAHERRAWLRGERAEPPQTGSRSDERQIFHLALTEDGEYSNLLLADLPGGLFRALADNQLTFNAIPLARRSDKLALLVDGARLRNPTERAAVLTRIRQLLERIATQSLTENGTELALVVTKWDLVAEDPETLGYWSAREHQLADEVREIQADAPHIRVAAGAPPSFPQDDGVGALRSWLLSTRGSLPAPQLAPDQPREGPREAPAAPEPPRRSWRRR